MGEERIPFEEYLLTWHQKDIKNYIMEKGLLTREGNFDKDLFKQQFDGAMKAGKISAGLSTVISLAPGIATAHEYLDDMKNAMLFYWVGTHNYVQDWSIHPNEKAPKDIHLRSAYARPQLDAAICNDRIGNRGRARQLFEWAAAHLTVTDDEKDQFLKDGCYNMVWEYTTDRAFCLLCLERWEEALAAAEEAERWMRMDAERKEKFGAQYTPFHLLPVYLALARFKVHPSLEREAEARKRLMLSEFKVRVNHLRHGALLYLFELWMKNPELLK